MRPTAQGPGLELTGVVPGGLYGTDGAALYLIDPETGATELIGPHDVATMGAIAFDQEFNLYGFTLTSSSTFYRIDPATGLATPVGPIGVGFVFEGGLACSPEGVLFAADAGNAFAAQTFTIDKETGAGTVVGPDPGDERDIDGMAFDGSTLFALDRPSGSLGTVDTTTGAFTPIGSLGVPTGSAGGLAVDPSDGAVYAAVSITGGFYRLNKETGEATLIAVNGVSLGLAFAPLAECFLVLGHGPGQESFTVGGHSWPTLVEGITNHYPVTMVSLPSFEIPAPRKLRRNAPPTAVGSFAAQVLMWNPPVFPQNPEQWTAGLHVTLWSDGSATAQPYGARDGMSLAMEVFEADGQRRVRFPFTIDGFGN